MQLSQTQRWMAQIVACLAALPELNIVVAAFGVTAYSWATFATSSFFAKTAFAAAMVLCLTAFCKANQQIRHRSVLIPDGEAIIKAQLGSIEKATSNPLE